jgi:Tyrosine-protein kinase ephrin type A/B receptor-like
MHWNSQLNSGAGANSSSVCARCAIGSYSASVCHSSCDECPPGTHSDNNLGSMACTPCGNNTYNPRGGAAGASACLHCPNGTVSRAGAQSANECIAIQCEPGAVMMGASWSVRARDIRGGDSGTVHSVLAGYVLERLWGDGMHGVVPKRELRCRAGCDIGERARRARLEASLPRVRCTAAAAVQARFGNRTCQHARHASSKGACAMLPRHFNTRQQHSRMLHKTRLQRTPRNLIRRHPGRTTQERSLRY